MYPVSRKNGSIDEVVRSQAVHEVGLEHALVAAAIGPCEHAIAFLLAINDTSDVFAPVWIRHGGLWL